MYAGAAEADEDAEFGGRPLWGWGTAVTAAVVGVRLLDLKELGWRVSRCLDADMEFGRQIEGVRV